MAEARTCAADGCGRAGKIVRGLCVVCYKRAVRSGAIRPADKRGLVRTCKLDGCRGGHYAHGMCHRHYRQKYDWRNRKKIRRQKQALRARTPKRPRPGARQAPAAAERIQPPAAAAPLSDGSIPIEVVFARQLARIGGGRARAGWRD